MINKKLFDGTVLLNRFYFVLIKENQLPMAPVVVEVGSGADADGTVSYALCDVIVPDGIRGHGM